LQAPNKAEERCVLLQVLPKNASGAQQVRAVSYGF
jgi:hypothetical protein